MRLYKVKTANGYQFILANNVTKALIKFPEPKPEYESLLTIDYLQIDISKDLKKFEIIDGEIKAPHD